MNEFEKKQDRWGARNAAEGREVNAEQKEKQVEEAEKKMAAKERIEYTSREIKTTKNQIQNIIANMTQVVKAVQVIRAQLKLAQNDEDIPSVAQDKRTLEGLQKKLDGLYGEIKDLKQALLAEEMRAAREENPHAGTREIEEEAERRVNRIVRELGIE